MAVCLAKSWNFLTKKNNVIDIEGTQAFSSRRRKYQVDILELGNINLDLESAATLVAFAISGSSASLQE